MIKPWPDLKYWNSGEWQVVEERIDDTIKAGKEICPKKRDLFSALWETPFEDCKVAIFGQDPYPEPKYATGLAFSIPQTEKVLPPTLKTIFQEYESDLHYPAPMHGDLTDWCAEGVLLWNVIPSCAAGRSLSHAWYEWSLLTNEIINKLSQKGIVMVFLGGRARRLASDIHPLDNCRVIEAGHPSALARLNKHANNPFIGSRIFTRINDCLTDIGLDPVNWRLPCEQDKGRSLKLESNE